MKKIQYSILFLGIAAVMALGASLPMWTARYHDRKKLGQLQYREMEMVELEIQPLDIWDKLKLLERGKAITLGGEEAVNTEAEIQQLVEAMLWKYGSNGFFMEEMKKLQIVCNPVMFYHLETDTHMIVWEVTISAESNVWMLLDDETTMLLGMSYEGITEMSREKIENMLYAFRRRYFEGWDMKTEILGSYMDEGEGYITVSCTDEQGRRAVITLNAGAYSCYTTVDELSENTTKEQEVNTEDYLQNEVLWQ